MRKWHLQMHFKNIVMCLNREEMQQGQDFLAALQITHFIFGAFVSPRFEKELHSSNVPVIRGIHERCEAILDSQKKENKQTA